MKKTVMIVDDEPDNTATVKVLLEQHGYNAVVAVNGDDCLKKLKKNTPDLILLDIMMPGTPVREVVKKIKGVKIIYLSAVRASDAEKEDLMKTKNVVGYVQKPFDVDDLVEQIKKQL